MRRTLLLAPIALTIAACGSSGVTPPETAQSEKPRDSNPLLAGTALSDGVARNTDFALSIYQQLRGEHGNMIYSPFSISSAFSMVYGGARTQTEDEMARVMRFDEQASQHPIFNKLDLELNSRQGAVNDPNLLQLHVVNDVWGQKNYPFLPEYLDLLAVNYGAGVRILDFQNDPDGSRLKINEWVANQTEDRIKDLLPEGSIRTLTRMVLTNAIYFKAKWQEGFDAAKTYQGQFNLLDGKTNTASFMHLPEAKIAHGAGSGWTAVELPYKGEELSMLVILPDSGKFDSFEQAFDRAAYDMVAASVSDTLIDLHLPKFQHELELDLIPTLEQMGLQAPFGDADFSGIDGTRNLYITGAFHKAFIDVAEDGTEAAAATAVVVGERASIPTALEVKVDRPFIYVIRDKPTGSILFVGRVLDPKP